MGMERAQTSRKLNMGGKVQPRVGSLLESHFLGQCFSVTLDLGRCAYTRGLLYYYTCSVHSVFLWVSFIVLPILFRFRPLTVEF